MIFRITFAIFLSLVSIQMIDCEDVDQMEVGPHKLYKDLNCFYPKISSLTKLRDYKYFISTNGQKFWLISDSDQASHRNSRELNTITTEWYKIDASFYYGLNVECGRQFRDKLILVNYNDKTKRNELMVGSLALWNWTLMVWSEFEAFQLSSKYINWNKSIDGIAIIDETLFLFQDLIQMRIDCNYKQNQWVYQIYEDFRQIPLNGPFDAAYCEDRHKDTYPLYAIRGKSYFICYIKENNDEFPTCEEFPVTENSITPLPSCFVARDVNERLLSSLFVQMIIFLFVMIALLIFSSVYLWNLWHHLSEETQSSLAKDKMATTNQNNQQSNISAKKDKTPKKVATKTLTPPKS